MRVHDEVLELLELEADSSQLDAPFIYASAREGVATSDMKVPPIDLTPLFEAIVRHARRHRVISVAPFQMLISTIDHSPYLGRLGIGRIERARFASVTRSRCFRSKDPVRRCSRGLLSTLAHSSGRA